MILSRSFSDHHIRCGGWLNLEFSKRESTWDVPKSNTQCNAQVPVAQVVERPHRERGSWVR